MSDEQPQRPTDAQRFTNMAKRIEHNTDSTFGGAFVIVPPPGAGEPIEALLLDEKADPVQFLKLLESKIKHNLDEIDARERRLGR